MTSSVRPFNLYLAGNALYENNQMFINAVRFCASRFEAGLHQIVQTGLQVRGEVGVEWKSLSEDSDERFFKSWASLNENKNAYALVLVERRLFVALVEKVCGGEISGEVTDLAGRKITSVEWRFHRRITDLLLKNLRDAMSSIAAFDIEILKKPKEVSHAQRIHTNRFGNVMSDIFHVKIEDVCGIIKVEYPAILVRQAMDVAFSGKAAQSRLSLLKESLQRVPLTVTGTIPMMEMPFNDLLEIKKGDFLPLPDNTSTQVSIGGKPAFHAELETLDGRLALVLDKHIQHNDRFRQIEPEF